jgi:hypothetical protein
LEQRLGGGGIEGAFLTAVGAGLVAQGGELTVGEAVDPGFEGFGRVVAAVPGLLGGFVEGAGQRESALARLQDRLDGGEASQGATFLRIVVEGDVFGVHGDPEDRLRHPRAKK